MARTSTLKTIEGLMERMILDSGYAGLARYVRNEIEIGVHLDAGITMTLRFPVATTPSEAVTEMVKVLDKLNGRTR
jgi:hypothetical protein